MKESKIQSDMENQQDTMRAAEPNQNYTGEVPKQPENAEAEMDLQEIEKLLAAIEQKNQAYDELNNRYLRLQADFDNFRRRTRQEKEELAVIVTQDIVASLLPVMDNFDRALQSATPDDADSILTGLNMIHKQFTGCFEKLGVSVIEAVGKSFDPNFHEAVMRVEDETQPDGTVVDELQKGYMVAGKVVRPSMVKVVNNS